MEEFDQEQALADYEELSRRIAVGAYEERSAEHHLTGTYPEDGVEEAFDTLTRLAAQNGLQFTWSSSKGYALEQISAEQLEAFIDVAEGDIYIQEVREGYYTIHRYDGENWGQLGAGHSERDIKALVAPQMQFLGESKGKRKYYRPARGKRGGTAVTKKYCLETMSGTDINAVIYEEVMRGSRRPCKGAVTVSIAVREQMPDKAAWTCTECSARGECSITNGISVPLEHARVAPDYINDRDLAIKVLTEINTKWSRPQRFRLDFYLLGIERRKAGEFIERRPLVDRMLGAFQPAPICYAVMHTLNEFSEKEEAKRV